MRVVSILMMIMVVLAPVAAGAVVIHVPGDAPTIQGGIDLSNPGDTILVWPGAYAENLFLPQGRTLESSSGPGTTIIDGGAVDRVIEVGGGFARIAGFTIRNGAGFNGAGVFIYGGDLELEGNVFENNRASNYGGALFADYSFTDVVNNVFRSNDAGQGAGMYLLLSAGTVDHNSFFDNTGTVHGGGIYISPGYQTISYNLFVNNTCGWRGGAICVVGNSSPRIISNTIVASSASQGGGIYAGSEYDVQRILNNIIVGSTNGWGIFDSGGSPEPYSDCNDLFNNVPSDYFDMVAGPSDISDDPMFCDPAGGDYTLDRGSPCAPAQQPSCGLIGAFGVACGATAVEHGTWGRVKTTYR